MPLQKLQLRPGINRESTSLANEGTWFEMDKVRFRSGYPEKIGGWTKDTGTYYNNGVSLPPATQCSAVSPLCSLARLTFPPASTINRMHS